MLITYPRQLDGRSEAIQLASLEAVAARGQAIKVQRIPYGGGPGQPPPAPDPAQQAAFAHANILFAGQVPENLGALAPHLRWVQTLGADVGPALASGLDLRRVALTSGAGLLARPIAEFVIGRILAHWKKFDAIAAHQRAAAWVPCHGRDLAGSTLGIVGYGAIGGAVALLAGGLGMSVHVASRRGGSLASVPEHLSVWPFDALDEMLAQCDAVVLCAAANDLNKGLFSHGRFSRMVPGAYFVNVARGSLVDERALVAALESGQLGGAAIDVTGQEPLPPDSPLWRAPNLAISAHCSAGIERFVERGWALFLDNLDRFLAGQDLRNRRYAQ